MQKEKLKGIANKEIKDTDPALKHDLLKSKERLEILGKKYNQLEDILSLRVTNAKFSQAEFSNVIIPGTNVIKKDYLIVLLSLERRSFKSRKFFPKPCFWVK